MEFGFKGIEFDRTIRVFETRINEAVKINYSELLQNLNSAVRSSLKSLELSLRINIEDLKCTRLEEMKSSRGNNNFLPPDVSKLKDYRISKQTNSQKYLGNELLSESIIQTQMPGMYGTKTLFAHNKSNVKREPNNFGEVAELEEQNYNETSERKKKVINDSEDASSTYNKKDNRNSVRLSIDRFKDGNMLHAAMHKNETNSLENASSSSSIEVLLGGWRKIITERKSGATAGRFDVKIVSPMGKRFRSKVELSKYFDEHPSECDGLDLAHVKFSR